VILVRESSSAKGAVDVVTGVKKLSRNKMERGMEASFREREREREREAVEEKRQMQSGRKGKTERDGE